MDEKRTTTMKCPYCGGTISVDDRRCPHCGINLGMAAAMAEQMVSIPPLHTVPSEMLGTDALVPKLGERLVQAGLVTPRQVEAALEYQRESAQQGKRVRLGQALVQLGFIDRETLDRVVAEIILQLQEALYEANTHLERTVEERTRQLQHALERLSELQRLKSNFVANISHELRTPLTHLIGYLDLCHDGTLGPLTQDQAHAVQVMRRSADRLFHLIEDLISFSMLSQGSLSVAIERVSVDAMLQRVWEVVSVQSEAREVTLKRDVPPGLFVFADEEKIGWVLHHLLDNAIKFTPAGGEVMLKVWPEESKVFFMVEDNGIGIPKEAIKRIFDPFVQVEDAARRRYGGTGLGLALVKKVLEAHDTEIHVESEPQQGSRFTFALLQAGGGSRK